MTYDPSVPNAAQSPGLFPPQNATNFARLKTLINADHVFNDTAQATDGVHRQVTLIARADPVSLPAGTNGIFYNKTFGSTAKPFYYDGARIFKSCIQVGSITFNSAATVQGTAFNATVAVASSIYTITFTVAVPTSSPYAIACIEPSNNIVVPKVISFNGTTLVVKFLNQNNTLVTNITRASVIVFGE